MKYVTLNWNLIRGYVARMILQDRAKKNEDDVRANGHWYACCDLLAHMTFDETEAAMFMANLRLAKIRK